jgi:hypothetical protein
MLAIMSSSHGSGLATAELLRRAKATSLNSARIMARSIELIWRSTEISQNVARACERACSVRTEIQRTNPRLSNRPTKLRPAANFDQVAQLLLTSPMLLELAEEFRCLARGATTPETRSAFEDLAFRYTALAAGYDNERVGSRTLH